MKREEINERKALLAQLNTLRDARGFTKLRTWKQSTPRLRRRVKVLTKRWASHVKARRGSPRVIVPTDRSRGRM